MIAKSDTESTQDRIKFCNLLNKTVVQVNGSATEAMAKKEEIRLIDGNESDA